MVGLPYDCLTNPLGAVRLSFEKAVASGSDPSSLDNKDFGAINLFRDYLSDSISQVPLLNPVNVQWLQPNTLVRYRGMIQDMLGNEFYAGAYKDGSVWKTNKYMDASQFPIASSSEMRIWERRLLYCVSVPGKNLWTESFPGVVSHGSADWTSPNREKRPRESFVAAADNMVSDDEDQGSSAKKIRQDEHQSPSSLSKESMKEGSSSNASMMDNSDRKFLPCLVKIYDVPESDTKLNDVFEFVGVLMFDSMPTSEDGTDEFMDSCGEDTVTQLPSDKVPRLHCIIHKKLAVHDFLSSAITTEPRFDMVKQTREALLGYLTCSLGNDGLVAHFILLHLLSKVHARVDNVAVGKLSLNLTRLNPESMSIFGNALTLAIKNVLPFTHSIALTVDYLNTASLAPKKDYETNRLDTGVLQLPEGSHITVDETQLQSGTLNSVGVENTRLLKNLMELQKVEYDFQYYKVEMAADVQLLILSEGKSNILPADVVIPLQPCSVSSSQNAGPNALEAWRWYLATVRSLPHSINQEMQKVIGDDLVAARQADRSLGSNDLSRWLTIGRLISASYGETSLSPEHWQMAKELERLRMQRLK